MRIWKGAKQQLALGLEQDLYITIPRRQYKKLQARMDIKNQIIAPVAKGQPMGTVTVSLHDRPLAEVPLVALEQIDSGTLWQNAKDSALLWLE